MPVRTLLTVGESRFEYFRWGVGGEIVLCLHGFGRSAFDFEVFIPLLSHDQSLVALNLLQHGNSVFPADRVVSSPPGIDTWCAMLDAVLDSVPADKVHLVGYSLGGRLAMAYVARRPHRVSSLLLMATDGLFIHPFYRLFAMTLAGRRLGRFMVDHPLLALRLVKALIALRLLSPNVGRIALGQLSSRELRWQVYAVWTLHRKIHLRPDDWLPLLSQHGIGFRAVFGQYDKLIPPVMADRIAGVLRHRRFLLEAPLGHRLLVNETAAWLLAHRAWCPQPN